MKNLKLKKVFIFVIVVIILVASATILINYINSNKSKSNIDSTKNNTDSSTNDNSYSPYYKSLYGTWVIASHVNSNMETTLSDSIISFCIGKEFTIEKDKITSNFATISNPAIEEGIMTASDFSNKYNDTFKNLGMSGDKVKYVRITQPENTNNYVTIFIADDGKVYALLRGALFELEKK
jgi:hypothetical protein